MQDPSTLEIVIRTLIALPLVFLISIGVGTVWVWILERGERYDAASPSSPRHRRPVPFAPTPAQRGPTRSDLRERPSPAGGVESLDPGWREDAIRK